MLTLLSRAYCHLCDDMREALAPLAIRAGAHVVELDV
ncbi:MAG TPA: glutaredoxin family protein, partial [Casimicrobiaceae bacterium]|nr:glutaredoxin family protein [Casimicrobiaceae bacterium]